MITLSSTRRTLGAALVGIADGCSEHRFPDADRSANHRRRCRDRALPVRGSGRHVVLGDCPASAWGGLDGAIAASQEQAWPGSCPYGALGHDAANDRRTGCQAPRERRWHRVSGSEGNRPRHQGNLPASQRRRHHAPHADGPSLLHDAGRAVQTSENTTDPTTGRFNACAGAGTNATVRAAPKKPKFAWWSWAPTRC